MKALLAIIAVLLAGILAVGILLLTRDDPATESPERKQAREQAETDAEWYCSLTPAGNRGIYSEEFRACVEARVDELMEEWDEENG